MIFQWLHGTLLKLKATQIRHGIYRNKYSYALLTVMLLKEKESKGISASWITPELNHDMFERDRLKKVASRSQSDADWTNYKQQKNKDNCNVKKAKITYYNNLILKITLIILETPGEELTLCLGINPKP